MKRIIISDLHLDESRPDLTRAFITFLQEKAVSIDELYILGDFFEVWLGDDHDTPFNAEITALLKGVACKTFVMHGNRDFLIGDAFCAATGATLLTDPSEIMLGDQKALLMHGDSLCTRDIAYMKARAQLRSPLFQADFLTKSIEERTAIARQIRGESAALTRETADDIMDVTLDEVEKVMEEAGVQILIHGHTHRPAAHEVHLSSGKGIRYVLGDWGASTHYLETDGEKIALREYRF